MSIDPPGNTRRQPARYQPDQRTPRWNFGHPVTALPGARKPLDQGAAFVVMRNGVPVGEVIPLRRRRFVARDTVVVAFPPSTPSFSAPMWTVTSIKEPSPLRPPRRDSAAPDGARSVRSRDAAATCAPKWDRSMSRLSDLPTAREAALARCAVHRSNFGKTGNSSAGLGRCGGVRVARSKAVAMANAGGRGRARPTGCAGSRGCHRQFGLGARR